MGYHNMPKGVSIVYSYSDRMSPLLWITTTTVCNIATYVGSRFTVAVLSDLHLDLFCADFAQLGIHLIEVAIDEVST